MNTNKNSIRRIKYIIIQLYQHTLLVKKSLEFKSKTFQILIDHNFFIFLLNICKF